jgi:tetratricopeptide (TPR) repeat protein
MTQFTPSIKRVEPSQTNVKGSLDKAKALSKEKRFEEALAEVEAVLKADPSSVAAHQAAGNLKVRLKRDEEALTHFQTIIRLDPRKAKAYLRSGKIYLDQQKLDKALEQFDTALKLDPKSTAGYLGSGQALVEQEKYDEAIKQFSTALRLNPRLLPARQRLALAYSKKHQYAEAIAQLKSALRIDPASTSAYSGLGRIYLLQKDFGSARESYQEALKLNPQSPASVHVGLAEALIAEDRLGEATKVLTEIPQKDQDSARIHKVWGDLYKRQGLFKEATEEYQSALLISGGSTLDNLADLDFMTEKDDIDWEEMAESFSTQVNTKVAEKRAQ